MVATHWTMGWKRSIVEVLLGLFYQHLWSQVKHCLQLIGKAVVSKINESHQIKQLFRICWLVVSDKGIGVWQYLMHFKPPKCQLTDHSCDKIIINSVPEVNLLPPLFVFVDEIFLVMVGCSSGECCSICFVSDCWWWLGSMKKRQICARSQGSCCSYLIFVFFWHHHYFKLKIWHWKHVNLNTTEHLSTATAACGACDKYQVCWCWCIGGKKKLHEKLTNTLAKLLKKLPKKIWFQRKICNMLLSAERIHLV